MLCLIDIYSYVIIIIIIINSHLDPLKFCFNFMVYVMLINAVSYIELELMQQSW